MSRLIDADALMIELMDSDLDHLQRDDWKEMIQIVADAPTITPEPHWIPVTERLPEIIRCKDCKYWERSSCCEGYCAEIDMEGFDEDHYCGFAERREVTT